MPPKLKPIKQVELWKKWVPLLPEYARAITYPKPSDDIVEIIKERNRAKTKEINKRKKVYTSIEVVVADTLTSIETAVVVIDTTSVTHVIVMLDYDSINV